ncbi:hypothetical protein NNC19_05060 [Clostridium sp. SHJSY1]|uniref:hypothetical protein n=1 Tax=Clostridium sp. SHJSY1 TaxID=2942483 RepID=UPI002875BAF0|nr:hypothetical protein [Clostridium sp. SHJSY1]MDS0525042.1 hypothetical protein [Clostridium sp. SHJSY1]
MKLVLITKKQLLYFLIFILFLVVPLLFVITNNSSKSINVFNQLHIDKPNQVDLNGDGKKDSLTVLTKNGTSDIEIVSNTKTFYLSNLCDDNILSSDSSWWPLSIYIGNLSRNTYPQIIVQGTKNNKPINYVFTWKNDSFINILTTDKNIFGIINSKGTKTPQCYSLNSFNSTSTFSSFMIIDNSLLDTTQDTKVPPSIDNIQSFIDIIQKDYEIDTVPNIFKDGMSEKELSLLWNLDKEHNVYSFENGFFFDENIDTEGNITSIKWRLNFEKYIKEKSDSYKSQIHIYLTCEKVYDGTFKISSFYSN